MSFAIPNWYSIGNVCSRFKYAECYLRQACFSFRLWKVSDCPKQVNSRLSLFGKRIWGVSGQRNCAGRNTILSDHSMTGRNERTTMRNLEKKGVIT